MRRLLMRLCFVLCLVVACSLSAAADSMTPEDREVLNNMSVTRNGAPLSIRMVMRERELPR